MRAEIAATYADAEPEDILCFAGAEEAIYLAMRTLLEPSDHVVVLTPNYQAAETIPLSVCEVTGVALRPEDDWALDVDAVERALRPNTRMVSVNFPNNPTGAVPSLDSWHRLVRLCDERGITLFSDEVYRGLELEVPSLPQATDLSGTALSLNVMSKAYGLPGLRIGWIACRDRAVLDRLERAKHYTTICNSAPSEVLALIGLRARERLLERNRSDRRGEPSCLQPTSSRGIPSSSSSPRPMAAASAFRGTSVPTASRRCAPSSSNRPAYCCCRRASTAPR